MPAIEPSASCPMCGSKQIDILHERIYLDRTWFLGRCGDCRQHFTLPVPTEGDMLSFYEGDYHAELRTDGATERSFGKKYERYIAAICRRVKSGRALDVGCSTGLMVKMLCDRGFQAEGIELNSNSAAWGRQNFGVVIHDKPLHECGFEPGSFDLLLMTDVLEHTLHPRDFLREAGKLLKPRGFAFISFPDILSLESRFRWRISKLLKRNWMWQCCHIPGHTWEFTRPTAEACFTSAGFRVLDFARDQPPSNFGTHRLELQLLNLPVHILEFPPLNRQFGTQMEFVLQKTS